MDDGRRPLEEVSLGARNSAVDHLAAMDPEYIKHLAYFYDDGTFGRKGAVSRRTKELAMVAVCCALRQPRGIRLHTERALATGASPRQVLEIMEVAAIPAGLPGLWLGVDILDEVLAVKNLNMSPIESSDGVRD